ncbi:MAG: hypothetical protein CBB87_10590 [Micavibrio sp. TMED27]|nr:hypothetical protein [Micavibrio sp.]OUT90200.1 MAG: hypothetical protein CBB87_10590 [Micavibrio sp. TMED27]
MFKNMFRAMAIGGIFAVSMLGYTVNSYAVTVTPPRLVFSSDEKQAYLYIKNTSQETVAYNFAWSHLAMDPDGNVVNLEVENAPLVERYRPLDDIVRFSPRRTILKPGQTQRVTFLIRRPKDLQDGEYRSHFLLNKVPLERQQVQERAVNDPSESKINVGIIVSRSLPVYVRHGEVNVEFALNSAVLTDEVLKSGARIVRFDISKTGNRSIIGLADTYCGDQVISTRSKVFAIYAEADKRTETMSVQVPQGGCSDMRIILKGHMDDPLRGEILGEAAVQQ